jgi:DNA polymerase
VDAKERLRLYLEQRRELGEYDLVLDKLPVADVLALLGARDSKTSARKAPPAAHTDAAQRAPGPPTHKAAQPAPERDTADVPDASPIAEAPPPPQPRFDPNAPLSKDWRAALRASGAAGSAPPARVGEPAPDARKEPPAIAAADASAAPSPTADATTAGVNEPAPSWLTALDIPLGLSVGRERVQVVPGSPGVPASLDQIAESVAHCTACALYASAIKHVPGEGNPHANFVCVGEAPGQNEDESGKPFVGPAGQLLTKILGAIELTRDDVFICNVLKHRPPGNRNPLPAEVQACRPFLEQQLALVRPRVILALGTFAAQTLLETTQPLGTLRGQIHRYHGVPLIVTYHPAALLRNEAWKRPTWQDVQLARRIHDASLVANPS